MCIHSSVLQRSKLSAPNDPVENSQNQKNKRPNLRETLGQFNLIQIDQEINWPDQKSLSLTASVISAISQTRHVYIEETKTCCWNYDSCQSGAKEGGSSHKLHVGKGVGVFGGVNKPLEYDEGDHWSLPVSYWRSMMVSWPWPRLFPEPKQFVLRKCLFVSFWRILKRHV